MTGGFDHLIIGTSLPFLLAPGLHHVEAFSEGLCNGAWGKTAARVGERLRRAVDLEHWAAFQQGFLQVARMTLEVASGSPRDGAPHRAVPVGRRAPQLRGVGVAGPARVTDVTIQGRILQAVCSPIRNPLPAPMVRVMRAGTRRSMGRLVRRLAKAAKVPVSPLGWAVDRGPWVDNNLAVLEVQPDGGLSMRWLAGDVEGRATDEPVLKVVAEVGVPVNRPAQPRNPA